MAKGKTLKARTERQVEGIEKARKTRASRSLPLSVPYEVFEQLWERLGRRIPEASWWLIGRDLENGSNVEVILRRYVPRD